MCACNQPYVMDYEWIWSGLPRTSVATLRVTLDHSAHPRPRKHSNSNHRTEPDFGSLLDAYFQSLHADQPGHGGRGGWAVHLRPALSTETQTVLDLVAAGQDAADAMEDATQYTYQYFKDFPGITFSWTQLPPERLDYQRD